MKRSRYSFTLLIIGLAFILLLNGCIDMLHYVGSSENRTIVNVRFTLQKMIFHMMAQVGGEEITDEDFESDFDLSEDRVLSQFPEGTEISFSPINNDTDFGFDVEMHLDADSLNKVLAENPDTPFLPISTEQGYRIVLPPMGTDTEDSADNEFAAAFFASAKYRLLISRDYIPTVEKVILRSGDDTFVPSIKELPEVYLVEFPLALWALAEAKVEIYIY